ncbi:MAG: hypothetical protein A2Y72_03330 [Chloroflexi bacterium RBG_13_53_26]|nr:MAG: hypothetical protein A2Y72_03330 [Chloroflexi bacterium RBG_13_53_26]
MFVTSEVYGSLPEKEEVEVSGVIVKMQIYVWKNSTVLSGDGWYVRVQDPATAEEVDNPIKQYPIEVQARGHAWAGGVDFLRAMQDWERIFRIDATDADRIPGRIDLCADVWIRDGEPSANEIYRLLIAGGDIGLIPEVWSLRARRMQTEKLVPIKVVGSTGLLPTCYIGSRSGLQLSIYEKTQDFEGNTRALIEGEWLHAGWVRGDGVVARFEFRCSREWIREQQWSVISGDGEIVYQEGGTAKLKEVWDCIPDIWRTCLDRFRLCPWDGTTGATRHRTEAPLWSELRRRAPEFFGHGWGRGLIAVKRGFDVETLRERVYRGLVNLECAVGRKAATSVFLESGQDTPERREYLEKTPWAGFKERWEHGK